jgi:hypothetical protein
MSILLPLSPRSSLNGGSSLGPSPVPSPYAQFVSRAPSDGG